MTICSGKGEKKMDSSTAYSGFSFTGTWITAAVVGNEMHQLLEAVLSITQNNLIRQKQKITYWHCKANFLCWKTCDHLIA